MKRIARMMLMNGQSQREDRHWDERRDERDRRREQPGYEAPEDRFRDRRGREHYDNGRYAPRNYYGRYEPKKDTGYPVDRPVESWDSYPDKTRNPYYPDPRFMSYAGGPEGPERETQPIKMKKIGFSVDGEMEHYPEEIPHGYRAIAEYPKMNEMKHRKGSYMAGHGAGEAVPPMDKETAEAWTQHMQNEDGSTGPHWTMEQTKQVQSQKGIDCDPVEFWAAMNMVYSDYCKVAKKLNVNNADFYAGMAEAFLDDKDAQPDKLARYYEYVVKH